MAYQINTKKCLRCGTCINQCPEKAIIVLKTVKENDGLVLYTTKIDPEKCTDCGVCMSFEWWCPAKAIIKVKGK